MRASCGWVLLATALGVVVGCQSSDAALMGRGKAASRAAFERLSGQLKAAMASGGPTAALTVCQSAAMPLTRSVADEKAVALSRVSHRPRNPANRATAEERQLIADYQAARRRGEALEPVIRTTEGARTFYAPIVITTPVCLKCHGVAGKDLDAKVGAKLKTLYPSDEATGFAMGDVRGLWRVRER